MWSCPIGCSGRRPRRSCPLVVYLHGSGGLGTDNEKQLGLGNIFGTRVWALPAQSAALSLLRGRTADGPRLESLRLLQRRADDGAWPGRRKPSGARDRGSADPRVADRRPAHLCHWAIDGRRRRVECPRASPVVLRGGDRLLRQRIDRATGPKRSTLRSGASMASPTEPFLSPYHGTVSRARRTAGGRPLYTEYAGVDHNAWEWAYTEPELLTWLFAQRRGH